MFRWLFPKKVSPTVQHIIDSLESNPNVWTLHESKEFVKLIKCDKDHPDAQYDCAHWRAYNYGWRNYVEYYQRPVYRFVHKLQHMNGSVVLIDHDATDYGGWVVEKPRHTAITKYDSDCLSKAVKKWREQAVLNELTKNNEKDKELKEALAEIEEELG
jgi:hypothetical protein